MDTFLQAIASAAAVWEQAILQVTWFHGMLAAAYLGTAWLCVLNAKIAKAPPTATTLWFTATAVLCLLGANSVLHGDVFITHFFRVLAKVQGWYGDRREWQYLVIAVATVVAILVVSQLRFNFAVFDSTVAKPMSAGLALLLILLAMRTISAHSTDTALNLRFSGLSLGRVLELAGMSGVVLGALRNLRLQ